MTEYINLCENVLKKGQLKPNRHKDDLTLSYFGYQMRFDLNKGFPLLTTKKINFDLIVHELLWFIKGDTNIHYLIKNNVNIWNKWAYKRYQDKNKKVKYNYDDFILKMKNDILFAQENGNLGPIYGKQWRDFNGHDQLKELIINLKVNPFSRRHIISAWNPNQIKNMELPPCHALFQFYVSKDYQLSCQLYQRSGDIFIGIPFNIASYSLLTMMIAHECNFKLGEFVHVIGDAHIYLDHIEQVKKQIKRKPFSLPKILLNPEIKSIFKLKKEDIKLENYKSHSFLKGNVTV
jgi:thymidylate synthase